MMTDREWAALEERIQRGQRKSEKLRERERRLGLLDGRGRVIGRSQPPAVAVEEEREIREAQERAAERGAIYRAGIGQVLGIR